MDPFIYTERVDRYVEREYIRGLRSRTIRI